LQPLGHLTKFCFYFTFQPGLLRKPEGGIDSPLRGSPLRGAQQNARPALPTAAGRTLDTLLTYTHFPGVLLQPLGHLSKFCFYSSLLPDSLTGGQERRRALYSKTRPSSRRNLCSSRPYWPLHSSTKSAGFSSGTGRSATVGVP